MICCSSITGHIAFDGLGARASIVVSKKRPDRERVKERLLDIQELSGGPHRISAINRHRQFALLHSAAKARAQGKLDVARGWVRMSKEARTEQWIDRLSPMELIERRRVERAQTDAKHLPEISRLRLDTFPDS
jgi:hypothetical protein